MIVILIGLGSNIMLVAKPSWTFRYLYVLCHFKRVTINHSSSKCSEDVFASEILNIAQEKNCRILNFGLYIAYKGTYDYRIWGLRF